MADGAPIPADVGALVMVRLKPILGRLARLEQTPEEPVPVTRVDPLAVLPEPAAEPDWNLVDGVSPRMVTLFLTRAGFRA
ncbi:MAG: hypothetical protein WCP35_22030, partial [Verrucomicrobiota bacterium]